MKRLRNAFWIFAALPVLAGAQGTDARSTAEIAARAVPATVTILALSNAGDTLGQGSGFFIRSSGVLLTNWHVMQGAVTAVVVRPNGERFTRVTFVDGDSALDVALLKVPGYELPVIETRADVPAVGERVVAIGSPLGLSRTVTEGIVSATRMVNGHQLVQISAAISPGSSGGAVLDSRGRVFAVSTSYLAGGQQLNFAVPVRYALGFLGGAIAERPLVEVFASAPSSGASRSSSPPVSASSQRLPPPERARIPRPNIDGAWAGIERAGGSGLPLFKTGEFLFIAGGEGFMHFAPLIAPADTLDDKFTVNYVADARTSRDGLVAFTIGGVAYDGYQTDSGFYVGSTWTKVFASPQRSQATFTPFVTPLSDDDGPYDIEGRTTFHPSGGGTFTSTTDWSGTLVAVVNRDSVWITVSLHNSAGGTTGTLGATLLKPDKSFDLQTKSARFTGSLDHGVIVALWRDYRDGGAYYEGRLRATRR